MKAFHWSSLALTGTMMAGLVGAAWVSPAPGATLSPRAVFNDPAHERVEAGDLAILARGKARLLDALDMRPQSAQPVLASLELDPVLNYDLEAVIRGHGLVPRVQLANMPEGIIDIVEVDTRKQLFFKAVLPLVLQVNEEILAERQRLWDLRSRRQSGEELAAVDKLWLAQMARRYSTQRGDIDALLKRHDVVPPSLALAQAATESAWGTSRFVQEGNAMFGEWTLSETHDAMTPLNRDEDKAHRVRAFPALIDSVRAYMVNLNRHRAYKEFRSLRAKMRGANGSIDGYLLAGTLHRYSERGQAYIAELQSIISANDLARLDGAKLTEGRI